MPKISDISINDRFVKALEVPTNAPHKIYWDGKTTGFGVRITQSGAVSFVLRYVLNGRERKYTIGNYPTHSALSARETAIKLKGEIAKGFDPLEERITDYNAYTLNELVVEYIAKMKGKLHKTKGLNVSLIFMKKILLNVAIILSNQSAFADFCSSPKEMQSIYIASKAVAVEEVCRKLGYSRVSAERNAIIMLSGDATPMSEYKQMKDGCQRICKLANTSGSECHTKVMQVFAELQKVALSGDKKTDVVCRQLNEF